MTLSPTLPRISVVVAVRNAVETLERALLSVLGQGYPELELIVIDGGSTDGTVDVIRNVADRLAFWSSASDKGVYQAWNRAIPHVNGHWVLFLGSDDELATRDVMSRASVTLAQLAGHVRIAYGSIELVGEDGSVIGEVGGPWSVLGPAFREGMTLPHPAVFYRRELFDERGLFDESYRIGGDYEYLLRDVLVHDPVWIPDLVVVRMGSSGLSSQPSNEGVIRRENVRARHAHGLVQTPDWLAPSVIRIRIRDWLAASLGPSATRMVGNVYRMVVRKPRL